MSEQKQQPIISIDHVSMRFNLAKEKHESLKEYFVALLHGGVRFDEFFALSDVSFDIMPGDFYGLIGLNGSGKSTLLKVISGVYKPSAGKVTVNGTIAPLIELGAGFDMDLTARENIYLNGTVLGYTPKYITIKGKTALVKDLKAEAKKAQTVYLATDPDREGEAISWHLANVLGLDPTAPNRVTFDEITKKGVQEGMAHPRTIDMDLSLIHISEPTRH